MNPRAQLKHALIRVNLMQLGKVRALKRLYGLTSKLALIEIYLTMSCATNAVISKDAILDIAEDNEVKDAEGFLTYCIAEGLIQPEMSGFSNSVVIEDQEQYAKKLKIKPTESVSSPDSPGKNPGKSPDKHGFPDNDSDTDTDLRSKKEVVGPSLPVANSILEAVGRWGIYLKRKWSRELDEIQRDTLLMNWSARPPNELIDGINQSIEKGYRKIVYEPPDERPQKLERKTKAEQFQDELKRIAEL